MTQVTEELYSWKEELEAIAIGLVGSLDFARQRGVEATHLGEIQDVIDNTKTAAMDLAAAIRSIESE